MAGLRENICAIRSNLKGTGADASIYKQLADVLFSAGKVQAGLNVFEKVLNLIGIGNDTPSVKVNTVTEAQLESIRLKERGLEYADGFLYEDAANCFEESILLNSDNFETRYCLAGVLRSLKRESEALIQCETAIANNPNFPPAYLLLANLVKEKADYEKCMDLCQKALSIDSESIVGHYDLSCYLALSGQSEKAIQQLEKVFQLGFRDFDWVRFDPDFKSLKESAAFVKLLERYSYL